METVLAAGLDMVKNLMPDKVGTNKRWTDSVIQTLLVAADREVRERCGIHYYQQEITLENDTYSYTLDPEFVSIDMVEFSHDGTNYDWQPNPIGLTSLDGVAPKWRTLRGGRVDYYSILSAPGVQTAMKLETGEELVEDWAPSQIVLYPVPSVVTAEKIRVTGVGVVSGTIPIVTAKAPVDVIGKCHVPRVLSVLYASESPERAAQEYADFVSGCLTVRTRFISQYGQTPNSRRAPW